jgi:hypothetical protein
MTIDDIFARYFEEQRAFDAAWRWFRRNRSRAVKLSEIIARVHARCPDVDADDIRREVERRLARKRYRGKEGEHQAAPGTEPN